MRSAVIVTILGVLFFVLALESINSAAMSLDLHTPVQSVYTWHQLTTGDWQSPTNWTPARTTPAPSDILVFSLGGTTTVTNVPTQIIGQLLVSGNTIVNLRSTGSVVLTIVGGDGDDLLVATGSALNFDGADAILMNIASGVTGKIQGFMTFSSPGLAAHRLSAVDIGSVIFGNEAVFTTGTGFTGSPFGTTNLDSVVFENGSKYVCIAGSDPFGAIEPLSVVVFKTGSLFSLQGNVSPSFSGRTYADFEMNVPGSDFYVTGSSALVVDNLAIMAGKLTFGLTGSGHRIKGNIVTLPGTRLDFQPTFPGGTINFNGNSRQTITIQGNSGTNGGITFAFDNSLGVLLDGSIAMGNLNLVNGVVDIPNPLFYMLVSGTVSRTNGYVNGYVMHLFLAPSTFVYPVGTENGYAPVSAQVTSGNFPAPLEVRPVQMVQPNILDPTKALSRYWTIGQYTDITANVRFDYLDPIDIPPSASESNFVIQRYYGSNFTQPSGFVDTQANYFHSSVFNFNGDWTLAEPGAVGGTFTPTSTPTNTPTSTPTATPSGRTAFDYDGDHKTDISVFRPSDGAWYLQQSQAGLFGMLFGFGSDKIAPADYDGDGKTDIAVYRPSTGIWYVLRSTDGTVEYYVFGLAEDLPTPADYDGDGKADVSVYRPSTGTWYRQDSSDGSFHGIQFGATEDKPTIGDWDGDGKSDIAVFRPSTGAWYRINSGNGSIYGELFGFGTDIIAPADYDGDGKTDLAAYRPSTGIWYVKFSSNSTYDYKVFGLANDIPAVGDFDGDGKADICVFRPSDGTWYRQNSSDGAFIAFQFGANGDKPTMTAFQY